MLFPRKKVQQFANGEVDLTSDERDLARFTVRKILSSLKDEIAANTMRVASYQPRKKVPHNVMARWDQMSGFLSAIQMLDGAPVESFRKKRKFAE
jgi:hypothetical protein